MKTQIDKPKANLSWVYPGQYLVRELVKAVKKQQQGDPLQPVTVVLPTPIARRQLMCAMTQARPEGFFNVRFSSVYQLVQQIAAIWTESSPDDKRALGRSLKAQLLWDVSNAPDLPSGPLSDFLREANFQEILLETVETLEALDDDKLQVLSGQGARYAQLFELFQRYRKLRANFRDDRERYDEVADAIRRHGNSVPQQLGKLIMVLPVVLDPKLSRIWEALTGIADAELIAIAAGQEDYPAVLRRTKGLEALPDPLDPQGADADSRRARIEFYHTLDQVQEVRSVARRIMSLAAEGVKFANIAVLTPNKHYCVRVDELFKSYDFPHTSTEAGEVAVQPQLNFIRGISEMVARKNNIDPFKSWLDVVDLERHSRIEHPLSSWLRIIKSGKTKSVRGLRRYLKSKANSTFGSERMQTAAEDLLKFIEQLVESVKSPGRVPWSQWTDWFQGLLDHYYPAPCGEELDGALTELAQFSSDGVTTPSAERFLTALRQTILKPQPYTPSAGVLVAPIWKADAANFEAIFVLGMVEGSFPMAGGGRSLLTDGIKKSLDPEEAVLHTSGTHSTVQHHRFLQILESAPTVALYWPRLVENRSTFPATWFVDAIRQSGHPDVRVEDIVNLKDGVIISESADSHQAQAAYAEEYDIRAAASARSDASHELNVDPEMHKARLHYTAVQNEETWSDYEGNLQARLKPTPGASHSESAGSYGQFKKCPYDYFLQRVLQLDIEEIETDLMAISPLDRGSLVHDILEQFVKERKRSDKVSSQETLLQKTAQQHFESVEGRFNVGFTAIWGIEQTRLLRALKRWLKVDLKHCDNGWETSAVELWFGPSGSREGGIPGLKLKQPNGSTVEFKGRIDRLDWLPSEQKYLVLDYKTSASKESAASLQLPIYAAAVAEHYGTSAVLASYWYLLRRDLKGLEVEYEYDFQEQADRMRQEVAIIYNAVSGGSFPPHPNCKTCPTITHMSARKLHNLHNAPEIAQDLRDLLRDSR